MSMTFSTTLSSRNGDQTCQIFIKNIISTNNKAYIHWMQHMQDDIFLNGKMKDLNTLVTGLCGQTVVNVCCTVDCAQLWNRIVIGNDTFTACAHGWIWFLAFVVCQSANGLEHSNHTYHLVRVWSVHLTVTIEIDLSIPFLQQLVQLKHHHSIS